MNVHGRYDDENRNSVDEQEKNVKEQVEKVIEKDKKGLLFFLTFVPQLILAVIFFVKAKLGLSVDFSHVELLTASGFNESVARIVVFIVGMLDACVAVLLLYKPPVVVIAYALFWPTLPATFRYVHSGTFPIVEILAIVLLAAMAYYFRHLHYNELEKKLL